MTKETGYREMKARYSRLEKEAERAYKVSGMKRDKEYLEYVRLRLKGYTI